MSVDNVQQCATCETIVRLGSFAALEADGSGRTESIVGGSAGKPSLSHSTVCRSGRASVDEERHQVGSIQSNGLDVSRAREALYAFHLALGEPIPWPDLGTGLVPVDIQKSVRVRRRKRSRSERLCVRCTRAVGNNCQIASGDLVDEDGRLDVNFIEVVKHNHN